MASSRRRGGESSATRTALIEAAEQLILHEGYPAVTARNLADKLSLTRQIVHYYFDSMDDLFIAVIRHGAERSRERLAAALAAEEPLRALWGFYSDPAQATLVTELNALANRRPAVRAEVARFAEEFREIQTRALAAHLERVGVPAAMQPVVAIVILTALSQVLTIESAIDVTRGHLETRAFVDECLRAFAECRDGPLAMALPSLLSGARPQDR